jgi:hypothetical protein
MINTLNLRIILIILSSYCWFSCTHDIKDSFSNIENVKFEETTFKIKNYNNIILYDFMLENKSDNDYYYEDDMIEDLNCKRNSYNNMFDRLLLFDTINKTLYIDLFYNDLNFQNFIRDINSVNTLYNNSKIKVKVYYNFADSLKVYYGNVDFVDDLYNEDLNIMKSNKLKEMNKLIEKIKVRVKIYNYKPGPSVYKENATAKILEYEIYNNTKTK